MLNKHTRITIEITTTPPEKETNQIINYPVQNANIGLSPTSLP